MQYLFAFIMSFMIALVLTPLVKNYLNKKNIAMSKPRERDIHVKPIPRLGGVAIFITFFTIVLGYLIFKSDGLNFVNEKIIGIDKNLFGILLGSLTLMISGIVDDIFGMSPWQKLFWQFVSGLLVVYFGINIWHIANPFGGANIELGSWTYVIVPLWVVLVINVVNWLDGLDGLASGISGITLVILLLLSVSALVNQPATALICAILAGAVFGFLPYNFNPAKIFLGDSGSMFLGFMISVAAIVSGGKIATVALVLGIPILDALWVIIRRIYSGKSPMKADKFHLHHRFLDAGFTQKQIVLLYYSISILFGIVALQQGTRGKLIASLWLLLVMIIIGIVLYIMKKKKDINV